MNGNQLKTTSSVATPYKVYYVNERNVQGAAPDQNSGYVADTYWLSSLRNYSSIIKISPSATAKYWTEPNSQARGSQKDCSRRQPAILDRDRGNDTSSGVLNTDLVLEVGPDYIDSTQIE